ncbi:MAG TPA: glycerate kinase, partial [Actinomycetota bacterium]|nr:glycerate kinase [Actinomycetota bacterium]
RHRLEVSGPLGDPVEAEFGIVPTRPEPMGIVEMATASGLGLVPEWRRDPRRTTTRGTGELIRAAVRAGARRILVCVGGSATNDAGAGVAQALGIRLLDADGRELPPGGEALQGLARIDVTGIDPAVAACDVLVATDVDNPLTGPLGASAVYGPQKGASDRDVAMLDRALGHFAAIVHRDLGIDVRHLPGGGAAGGLGAGLVAFLGAKLRPGVDIVMESVRLPERLAHSDFVISGEGTFDEQSMHGKVPAGVLRMAEEFRVPAAILCGQRTIQPPGAIVLSLADRYGLEAALDRPGPLLQELSYELAVSTLAGRGA